jgi:DNA-binding MarR family transcriptional regulator
MTEPTEAAAQLLAPTELRYLVLAAQREGSRVFGRAVAALGLTPSQAEVLVVLHEYGPMSLRDLGEMIVCEVGSPSRIVDALVTRGLVNRAADPTDRRAVTLTLTDEGSSLVPTLRTIEQQMDAPAAQLPAEYQVVLSGVLRGYLAGTETGDAIERRFADKRSRA